MKVRIQKARQSVKGLPDMDREIEEQEEEIADLEARCEMLRGVLRGIAEKDPEVKEDADKDVKMEG